MFYQNLHDKIDMKWNKEVGDSFLAQISEVYTYSLSLSTSLSFGTRGTDLTL